MSLTTLSDMDAALEYVNDINDTDTEIGYYYYNLELGISISMIIIGILGVVGNGIVIWLLGFRVQRNPFMTYILNLAIADLGLLVFATFHLEPFTSLYSSEFTLTYISCLFFLMYSISQFLLTAISIDRCVAVFLPLWYRCHRPPCLSAIVCALMCILSILLTTATYTDILFDLNGYQLFFQLIVNAALCLPLVTISTLALFIKICFKPQQHHRGKLLTILLLTLSFFLLCAFPFNVIFILWAYGYLSEYIFMVAMAFTCLNSSVNPVIYFLVGRQRKTRGRETLKMILQRAFKEEEACTEETPVETQL